ncbi:MAG TPA: hypothetical protein VEK07_25075 [Polyangiaceae bacterium]|nr:hypothetical protein [Polyangiaceae bacterium]
MRTAGIADQVIALAVPEQRRHRDVVSGADRYGQRVAHVAVLVDRHDGRDVHPPADQTRGSPCGGDGRNYNSQGYNGVGTGVAAYVSYAVGGVPINFTVAYGRIHQKDTMSATGAP